MTQDGQGTTVGDVTFVYERDQRYGVYIKDMIRDRFDMGIVVNEIMSDEEHRCLKDALLKIHPIPQLAPMTDDRKKRETNVLERSIGLRECRDDTPPSYVFDMKDVMRNPIPIKIRGDFRVTYRHHGIETDTSFVTIHIERKQ
jgi:hypothetical protein